MDTTQSTVITVGQGNVMNHLQPNKSTQSGTMKTCYDCQYACVFDMNFEDILLCKQHNTYVSVESPICSKFISERWVK